MIEEMDTNEIKLTIKNNTTTSGIAFPMTPRPEVRDDGIFPSKKEIPIIKHLYNQLKRLLKPL